LHFELSGARSAGRASLFGCGMNEDFFILIDKKRPGA